MGESIIKIGADFIIPLQCSKIENHKKEGHRRILLRGPCSRFIYKIAISLMSNFASVLFDFAREKLVK